MRSYEYSPNNSSYENVKDLYIVYRIVLVTYNTTCAQFRNASSDLDLVTYEYPNSTMLTRRGACFVDGVSCTYEDPREISCRLNFRMQAGLTLAGCLLIKAVYMVVFNIRGRRKTKSHCLTFGDVLVAASSNPGARIHNECMVNAGDVSRHLIGHTCHKHCDDTWPSATGDGIGHCQNGQNSTLLTRLPTLSTQ